MTKSCCGALGRSRLSTATSVPMGAGGTQTAALLHSARRGLARHAAAHFSVPVGTMPARTWHRLPRCRPASGWSPSSTVSAHPATSTSISTAASSTASSMRPSPRTRRRASAILAARLSHATLSTGVEASGISPAPAEAPTALIVCSWVAHSPSSTRCIRRFRCSRAIFSAGRRSGGRCSNLAKRLLYPPVAAPTAHLRFRFVRPQPAF